MAVPLVLLLLVVVGVKLASVFERKRTAVSSVKTADFHKVDHGASFHLMDSSEPERPSSFFEQTLPLVLFVLFFLYPLVTKVAFEGFPCYSFQEDARQYLMADVSISCIGPDERPTGVVWAAVFLYPVGIMLFCAFLLFKASPAIIAGKETPLTRATAALHREYEATAFWSARTLE